LRATCFFLLQKLESDLWDKRIRWAFWLIGIIAGGLLTYTTRYFINGDAIAYVEMGEALRMGRWWDLANLTYSPGYPVLLGIGQIALQTNPMNELQLLRAVNFVSLILAMAACDLIMGCARNHVGLEGAAHRKPLPLPAVSALGYGIFLVVALTWIRMRLINPDMPVLFIVLICVAILLRIREAPERFGRYVLLGITLGAGYLVKSFFFVFSPVFFLVAALCARSARMAATRVIVAIVVMLIVSAPLIAALSYRMGRFSYGELGGRAYAVWIAGQGERIHPPEAVNDRPKVLLYRYGVPCTHPSGFDMCYWDIGIVPKFELKAQLKVFLKNVGEIFVQTPWLIVLVVWLAFQLITGAVHLGGLRPLSMPLVFLIPAVLGIGFYCLLYMEPRYLAPFVFLGLVGMTISLRYSDAQQRARQRSVVIVWVFVLFFLGLLAHSLVDQTWSGLYTTGKKLSYRDAFLEHVAVKDFLRTRGLSAGDEAGIVGLPPVYWARMAGMKVVGEIPQPDEFLRSTTEERKQAELALAKASIKVLIAKDSRFGKLVGEGWALVPSTRDYYALLLPAPR